MESSPWMIHSQKQHELFKTQNILSPKTLIPPHKTALFTPCHQILGFLSSWHLPNIPFLQLSKPASYSGCRWPGIWQQGLVGTAVPQLQPNVNQVETWWQIFQLSNISKKFRLLWEIFFLFVCLFVFLLERERQRDLFFHLFMHSVAYGNEALINRATRPGQVWFLKQHVDQRIHLQVTY